MNVKDRMFDFVSDYITKSDIYAASAIGKISAFIFKRRMEKHMSQAEFAKMMGVSQGMVSKWESADYNFTIEGIAQIVAKLNYSFDMQFVPENEYLRNTDQFEVNIGTQNDVWTDWVCLDPAAA